MFRQLMFSCACLAVLSAEAQKDKPWWLDPEVNEVNTMAPRAAFFAYETESGKGRPESPVGTLSVIGRQVEIQFFQGPRQGPSRLLFPEVRRFAMDGLSRARHPGVEWLRRCHLQQQWLSMENTIQTRTAFRGRA